MMYLRKMGILGLALLVMFGAVLAAGGTATRTYTENRKYETSNVEEERAFAREGKQKRFFAGNPGPGAGARRGPGGRRNGDTGVCVES